MRPVTTVGFAMIASTLLLLGAPRPAHAADDLDLDDEQVATYAVQKRLFRLGVELTPSVGFLPMNAFNKGVTAGGSIAYHMSTAWAWEIAQGGYVFYNFDSDLKKELLDNFGVQPTKIASVGWFAGTNLVWKPFYGKLAVVNRSLVHTEVSLPFGFAVAKFENPETYRFGPDVGVAFRVFLGRSVSLRLDVRDFILFKKLSPQQELLIALGMGFSFGGDER